MGTICSSKGSSERSNKKDHNSKVPRGTHNGRAANNPNSDGKENKDAHNHQSDLGTQSSLHPPSPFPSHPQSQMYHPDSNIQPKYMHHPPRIMQGLCNIGNTCYMNSVLQCFLRLSSFLEEILDGNEALKGKERDATLLETYADLATTMASGHISTPRQKLLLETIREKVCEVNPKFAIPREHDAYEFLSAFLEAIHNNLNPIDHSVLYENLGDLPKKSFNTLSSKWHNNMIKRGESAVTNLFCGQIADEIKCQCCQSAQEPLYSFDHFWMLTLSLYKSADNTLEDLCAHFFSEQLIQENIHCNYCKLKTQHSTKSSLCRLPKILIIHLKRFRIDEGNFRKNSVLVSIPDAIDLNSHIKSLRDGTAQETQYRLFALVNHSGELESGHYTAECMDFKDGSWHCFNDSIVERVEHKAPRERKDSYILFYTNQSSFEKNQCMLR